MEMMIVMVVVSIIVAGSLVALSNDPSDEVHTLPLKIEKLTRRSLATAKNDKRTQYILISPDHIWQSTDPSQTQPTAESSNKVDFPPNSTISCKRIADTSWQQVQGLGDIAIWAFSASGICEEISIRIELDNSSAEMQFHPLTAAIIKD